MMKSLRLHVVIVVLAILTIASSGLNLTSHPRPSGLEGSAHEPERYDEPAEAAQYYVLKRAPVGQTAIPVEKYLAALEHINLMPQHSTALDQMLPPENQIKGAGLDAQAALGPWTSLGPGNIGGRTRALLIDPREPNVMYAAGVAGGVWKSSNAGASWVPLGDLLPNLAVNSMAFDPADTNTIYAGTGEGYFNSDMQRGAGIVKTTDAGATWSYLESTATVGFRYVNDIIVSHNNRERIWAATRTGVWRSDDGGTNWSRSLNPLGSNGVSTVAGGCLDLAIRTDMSTDYLFASCGTFLQATVYRNIDAGGSGTWEAVLTEPNMGRTSLALAPSNQSIIYGLAASNESGNFDDGLLAVFRSDNSGEAGSWAAKVRNTSGAKLNTVLLSNPRVAFGLECFGSDSGFLNQGWYDNVIAVDPKDPERVWAGGVDLFRSDDGGATWGLASYWWANETDPHFVHADQHRIVFHPQYDGTTNRLMFVANDGGLFRTDNARASVATGPSAPCVPANTGVSWTSLNNGYGVTQFYHGVPYPNGLTYIGGTQDNGTLRGTDSAGPNRWSGIFGGDGGYVAVDPTNLDTIYEETTRLSIRKSTNGGASFQLATFGITESSANFLFINPFFMDPAAPQRLWTGGLTIWRTTDGADFWNAASAPNTGVRGTYSAFAIAPTNGNLVLAGTTLGYIHRTDAALTTGSTTVWPVVRPDLGFVSWLTFDPNNASVAYATYSTFVATHVWKSTDGGATWAGIDGSGDTAIPDIPVHTIVVDPDDGQRLYIGTDLGVFVSLDGGNSWARENTGFANVVTEALAIGSVGKRSVLFAFTHGRGAWRVTLGPARLRISGLQLTGKRLVVYGRGYDEGAVVLINGERQKTRNDTDSPATTLIAKRGGRAIPSGQTGRLQVQNPDGSLSNQFSFTRP